jgi:uncharacterized protein (TIGR02145 family)
MKQIFTLLAAVLLTATTCAQVGIGTTTPAGALDIASTTSGLVMPRVANTSVVVNPNGGAIENSTMVYDLSANCVRVFVNGLWSGCIQFDPTAPGAPVIGTATLGDGTATVSFTAPVNNGGSVITSYTATSSPGNITGTLTQSGSGTITVTGLTNGTAYTFTVTATNAIGASLPSAASNLVVTTIPGAPVIGTATLGDGTATVSFTAPVNNGGLVITSYTATSSPGNNTGTLTQSGSGTITVTGLTNGTAYTFTVTATNAIGASLPSAASNSVTPFAITTQVASNGTGGVYTFLNHNLGADTSLDPHTPVKGLNGDYYQWGKNAPDADVDALIGSTWGDQGGTTGNGNWTPDAKGPQDPCPPGYRVPSSAEWVAVNTYNTVSRTGTFYGNTTEFGNALHYGTATDPKQLTLPAAGNRNFVDGALNSRGSFGGYWSSAETGSNAYFLFFDSGSVYPAINDPNRTYGFSLRCIAE